MLTGINFLNNKKKHFLKTGLKKFDDITLGIPEGRITEISGKTDSGKTKLIFDIIENLANKDVIVCYITTNANSLDFIKARKFDKNNNFILSITNREKEIINIIKSYIKVTDLFIIDSIAEVLTNNEEGDINLNSNQSLPSFLENLNSIFYGEKSSLIVTNFLVKKNNNYVSRWNNIFKQYCSVRILIDDNQNIKLLSHKIQPNLLRRC